MPSASTLDFGGPMRVLIVESNPELAKLWSNHLELQGATVRYANDEADAVAMLDESAADIIVLNLVLDSGSAFAVADFASYRYPATPVIFVTNSSFFSDGSIFQHIPNACSFLPAATRPEDLAAVIDHYGMAQ